MPFKDKNFIKAGVGKIRFQKSFLSDKKTVCIKHKDGRITEHGNIIKVWQYINKVIQSPNVESAWVKDK